MLKRIFKDFKITWIKLRLSIILFKGTLKILLAISVANYKHNRFANLYKLAHPKGKPLVKNYSVIINNVAHIKKKDGKNFIRYKEKLIIISGNELFYLSEVNKALPKGSNFQSLKKKNSIFYSTAPKMKVLDAVKNNKAYLTVQFIKKNNLK